MWAAPNAVGFYHAPLTPALALRAADHPSHYLANGGFLVIAVLGWLAGITYKAAMPDMYVAK